MGRHHVDSVPARGRSAHLNYDPPHDDTETGSSLSAQKQQNSRILVNRALAAACRGSAPRGHPAKRLRHVDDRRGSRCGHIRPHPTSGFVRQPAADRPRLRLRNSRLPVLGTSGTGGVSAFSGSTSAATKSGGFGAVLGPCRRHRCRGCSVSSRGTLRGRLGAIPSSATLNCDVSPPAQLRLHSSASTAPPAQLRASQLMPPMRSSAARIICASGVGAT